MVATLNRPLVANRYTLLSTPQSFSGPEPHSTIDSVTALQPAAPSSHLLMLLRIIEGTAWNSGHRIDNNKIDTFSNRQKLSLTFICHF